MRAIQPECQKANSYLPEPHNTHFLISAYLRGDLARERLVRTLLEGVLAVFVAFAPAGITQTRHTCMWISVRVVQHGVYVCCGVGVGVCARVRYTSHMLQGYTRTTSRRCLPSKVHVCLGYVYIIYIYIYIYIYI